MKEVICYQCETCNDVWHEKDDALKCEEGHIYDSKIKEISALIKDENLDIVSSVNGVNCLICTKGTKVQQKHIKIIIQGNLAITGDKKLDDAIKKVLNKHENK